MLKENKARAEAERKIEEQKVVLILSVNARMYCLRTNEYINF
jgi:hypothetical protein